MNLLRALVQEVYTSSAVQNRPISHEGGVLELRASVWLSGERGVRHADEDNVVQVKRKELEGDLVLDELLCGPQDGFRSHKLSDGRRVEPLLNHTRRTRCAGVSHELTKRAVRRGS